MLVGRRVQDAIEGGSGAFVHGHAHAFNPLSAATGLATLRRALELGVPDNVADRGRQLGRGLEQLTARYDCIGEVRGRGLLLGLEFVEPGSDRVPWAREPSGSQAVVDAARSVGLLVYPAGVGHTTAVFVAPPLTITESETDELLELLGRGLEVLPAR